MKENLTLTFACMIIAGAFQAQQVSTPRDDHSLLPAASLDHSVKYDIDRNASMHLIKLEESFPIKDVEVIVNYKNDELVISFPEPLPFVVKMLISNELGKVIDSRDLMKGEQQASFNLESLTKGLYTFNLLNTDNLLERNVYQLVL
ncbi:MAG: hypothetical protein WEC59_11405 [Salibacteraceae bacterium]